MNLKPYFTVAVLHREAVWVGVHFLIQFQSVAMSSAAHAELQAAELQQNAGKMGHGLIQMNHLSLAAGGCLLAVVVLFTLGGITK